MEIEIVSHCFASRLPHYATALTYQLSSLILHPPKRCRVVSTVCRSIEDSLTSEVVYWFHLNTTLPINTINLDLPYLGRRCIGRNLVAKTTKADIVWFTDVDYTFQEGCLDALAELEWPEGATMIYPGQVMIHRDHATGDGAFERVGSEPRLIDINKSEFIPKRYNKAIGGVQIVRGDFAREHGYLDGSTEWQREVQDNRFHACKCDVPYRQFCKGFGKVVKVDLPGVYRMRHSRSAHGRSPRL